MPQVLYTIGYATKPLEVFIAQLKQYKIDVIADVRSVPYSKIFHDYHREAIADSLKLANIRYVYLGDELSPRSKDDAHYDKHGQVQFDRLMQSDLFASGIERLQDGMSKGFTIALMCAEKDPATCHRSLLIAYFIEHFLAGESITVNHIQHNGTLEVQTQLEQRVAEQHKCGDDLFMSRDEQLKQAYDLQLKQTSYTKP